VLVESPGSYERERGLRSPTHFGCCLAGTPGKVVRLPSSSRRKGPLFGGRIHTKQHTCVTIHFLREHKTKKFPKKKEESARKLDGGGGASTGLFAAITTRPAMQRSCLIASPSTDTSLASSVHQGFTTSRGCNKEGKLPFYHCWWGGPPPCL